MQKLKRIKKWNCTEENYSNNKLGSNMTSSTEIADAAAALKPVIFPNWTTMPNTTSGSNSIDCSARQSIIDNSRSNSSSIQNKHSRTPTLGQRTWSRASSTVNTKTGGDVMGMRQRHWLLILVVVSLIASDNFTLTKADEENSSYASTTPLNLNENATETTETTATTAADWQPITPTTNNNNSTNRNDENIRRPTATPGNGRDSIFMRFAQRFSTGNELWDGIIRDCYQRPSYSCFQKNVYGYLNEALEASDINVTQGLKFYKNQVDYEEHTGPTEAALAQDVQESSEDGGSEGHEADEHLRHNEIPHMARAAGETPIEEVTNALYGKSLKFAMTHDIELKLPEMMFDGATFRISPRSFEGNGIIAKLELIPKQEVQARLAGKIIMKKIQKFFKSKLLLSFLALVLIIKIIKIKLFWLLPLVVGVGAAKKLLLKFLLFLFPALSHLFKLCSYYQQTYHSTKYHHHHHLINHHHTVVPPWHNNNNVEHNSGPEIIYTQPPKGHISAYLHGAPIHETYGPPPAHEHFEGAWENSGPGLGSEYISDINRIAQVDENSNYFNPQTNDAHEIHAWGLGTTQPNIRHQQQQKQQQQQQQRIPATQQQRQPPLQKQQHLQPQQYQKPHATSQSFNPFVNPDKHSIFGQKFKTQNGAQSAPGPVYTPARNGGNGNQPNAPGPPPQQSLASAAAVPGLTASQIAAQYEPTRNNQQQQQQPLSPELSAQLKEAIRIQAEQRIISQQQKILEHQPFVQDGGQPIMPLNYDPFYSPILVKIDKIVEQLGVTDDLCKERLVCSMYKDPSRYSPHSNFVSSELSRDTSELQTVTNTNHPAVLRFYRLIQAARDGQDQRDCLRLYPQCSINTE